MRYIFAVDLSLGSALVTARVTYPDFLFKSNAQTEPYPDG